MYTALLPTDNAGLANFFRLRARGEPARGTLDQLVETLARRGGGRPAASLCGACRHRHSGSAPAAALVREGGRPTALARRCVAAIEGDGGALTIAAARVVVQRRAADAAGLLLAYLPHAENDNVLHDLQDALRALAHDDKGTADPAVVRALEDEHPLRRATAVVVLSEGDLKQHREALRKLLVDPAPSVRLRAALALARADDTQAVATLINLLGEVSDRDRAWRSRTC